ncbi:hypothetical protein [Sphingomonas sp.]|uniref:hypothetical protein n=1 Tax=Sphingomonas sp. TaxID=28214 RepID=UPI002DED4C21|nr:hypothetical protein [Sphingomonas sp.]
MTYPATQSSKRDSGSEDRRETSASEEDVVVVLLNKGLRATTITGVALNLPTATLYSGPPHSLQPGEVMVLPTGIFRSGAGPRPCAVPLRLYVAVQGGSKRQLPVEISGLMPTSLPDRWAGPGACSQAPPR